MDAINVRFKVVYNGKNITADISNNLLKLTYTDNVSGVADLFEILFEDTDGKWANDWYPSKGASLLFELGYKAGRHINPNKFEISNIRLTGDKDSGDRVAVKAVSAGIAKQLHTKRSHGHENKTLSEIVHSVASKYGLTVIGNIEDISIGRVTQRREKDLTFLSRLANEYGYAFNIKGDKLSFVHLNKLEATKAVAIIDKTDCASWEINDKGFETFNQAIVRSHNPNKNKVVQSTFSTQQVANKDGVEFSYLKEANNSIEIRTKTENEQQANAKSAAALHKANSLQQTAIIALEGNTMLLAGCNVELTGFGRNSGIWNILKSTHDYERQSGYTTEIELKRVLPATISGSKKAPKVVKLQSPKFEVVSQDNRDGVKFNYIR